ITGVELVEFSDARKAGGALVLVLASSEAEQRLLRVVHGLVQVLQAFFLPKANDVLDGGALVVTKPRTVGILARPVPRLHLGALVVRAADLDVVRVVHGCSSSSA